MYLNKRPGTEEEMKIYLHHYLGKLMEKVDSYESFEHDEHEIRGLEIEKIKTGKYDVAPNIKFLIERGDIKS